MREKSIIDLEIWIKATNETATERNQIQCKANIAKEYWFAQKDLRMHILKRAFAISLHTRLGFNLENENYKSHQEDFGSDALKWSQSELRHTSAIENEPVRVFRVRFWYPHPNNLGSFECWVVKMWINRLRMHELIVPYGIIELFWAKKSSVFDLKRWTKPNDIVPFGSLSLSILWFTSCYCTSGLCMSNVGLKMCIFVVLSHLIPTFHHRRRQKTPKQNMAFLLQHK